MVFLDGSRDSSSVDDVLVYLLKEGLSPEKCGVRITGLEEHSLKVTLLNEPNQNFGCHCGEEISFLCSRAKIHRLFAVLCFPHKWARKIVGGRHGFSRIRFSALREQVFEVTEVFVPAVLVYSGTKKSASPQYWRNALCKPLPPTQKGGGGATVCRSTISYRTRKKQIQNAPRR